MFSDNSPATDQVWKEGAFLVAKQKKSERQFKSKLLRNEFSFLMEDGRKSSPFGNSNSVLMLEKEDGKYR